MVALTHSINEEEVDYGIRACVICPGEVETPILELRPEPVSAARRATMLQPEDVSAAVLFVASLPPRACVPELIIKPTTQIYR
jgi:NADP-dependent 3-hydroxy acid dehydrogenase YdfG